MRAERTIAYTTVMTMMRILEEKGYLQKSASDRAHVYTPANPRQQVMGAMVRDFVDRVFDGAPDSLLLHLAQAQQADPEAAADRPEADRGHRGVMMETLTLANIAAYSAQVLCIVALATLVWALLRIDAAGIRYGYWRVILALCLLLPLLQRRQTPSAAAAGAGASVDTQIGLSMVDVAASAAAGGPVGHGDRGGDSRRDPRQARVDRRSASAGWRGCAGPGSSRPNP